ncbi:MAG: zinc ribbon domain-containing protein [Thermoplasmata archaeon]
MVNDEEEEVSETEGNNYGTYVLVLGVIITIGVLGLKAAAMASGTFEIAGVEVADKIYTGGDHFSTYFFSGLIVGILVIIIGIATSSQAKKGTVEEEEVEETWKEEEEEEGICPTCGAVIPIDSEVCPECGEELAPPGEEEEEIEEIEVIECPICGAEVESDAEECPECGEPLTDIEEEEEDLFEDL